MKQYKYEMNVHTSEGSLDSFLTATQAVKYYYNRGYTGLCVTDYFTGQTTRPDNLSWECQVDVFCTGYENALKAADGMNIKVFFGLTISHRGNDFILLNIDKEWLKSNPDMLDIPLKDLLVRVRAGGGFVIHAHPFLENDTVEMICLLPYHVDAIEVNNAAIDFEYNCRAEWYAYSSNLKVVGSDSLRYEKNQFNGGIITNRPAETVKELTDMIRAGQTRVLYDNHECAYDWRARLNNKIR